MVLRTYTHDITHWAYTGMDGYGAAAFLPPRLVKGRWEDRAEQIPQEDGLMVVSRSVVWLQQDFDYNVGDFLAYGDFTASGDPINLEDAYRIRHVFVIDALTGSRTEKRVYL